MPRPVPSGLTLPWLLALIGGGFVMSILGMVIVNWIGPLTLGQAAWYGANLVVWMVLSILLAGTEQPRITWVVARSARQVDFSSLRLVAAWPRREVALAVFVFALLLWNWAVAFGDVTILFPLAAAAIGIPRVVRRAPFSRWQWIGCGLLVVHESIQAFGPVSVAAVKWTSAPGFWFQVVLWWMFTHRAVKREDEGLAARVALTQASYFLADGQFQEADRRVRAALPLATTNEIASAALKVLAASLVHQQRLAEAERALRGSLELTPDDEDAKNRLEEVKRTQLV